MIAKRLERFIDAHIEYCDCGSSESGPEVSSFFEIPTWAERLITIDEHGFEYWLYVYDVNGYDVDRAPFSHRWAMSDRLKQNN